MFTDKIYYKKKTNNQLFIYKVVFKSVVAFVHVYPVGRDNCFNCEKICKLKRDNFRKPITRAIILYPT